MLKNGEIFLFSTVVIVFWSPTPKEHCQGKKIIILCNLIWNLGHPSSARILLAEKNTSWNYNFEQLWKGDGSHWWLKNCVKSLMEVPKIYILSLLYKKKLRIYTIQAGIRAGNNANRKWSKLDTEYTISRI